jgi:hypothetical protein
LSVSVYNLLNNLPDIEFKIFLEKPLYAGLYLGSFCSFSSSSFIFICLKNYITENSLEPCINPSNMIESYFSMFIIVAPKRLRLTISIDDKYCL